MEIQTIESKGNGGAMAIVDSDELRSDARKFYGQMQTSWFLFGKAVSRIRSTGAFKDYGKGTFRDFCNDEFPSMHFSTIVKTIRVADGWGEEIEARLEENPSYRLPALESCYSLTTSENILSKPELLKLKTSVLEGNFGYATLRSKLKSIINTKRDRDNIRSSEEIENELVEDLKSSEMIQDETEFLLEDTDSEAKKCKSIITQSAIRIEFLSEQLTTLGKMLEANPDLLTSDLVSMGHEADELCNVINDFLKQLEDAGE